LLAVVVAVLVAVEFVLAAAYQEAAALEFLAKAPVVLAEFQQQLLAVVVAVDLVDKMADRLTVAHHVRPVMLTVAILVVVLQV
jgi:hypothetical protein